MHQWVRNFKVISVYDFITIKQYININRSGAPFCRANPAHNGFYALKVFEQSKGRYCSLNTKNSIQKHRLWMSTYWRCLVKSRKLYRLYSLDSNNPIIRKKQISLPITYIRPYTNIKVYHDN